MTRDPLDDLLERSSPAIREAAPADLNAMISSAARRARPKRVRHGVRIGIVLGAATLFAAGGGVAVAGGLIDWAPKYASPDMQFDYTLSSGRHCELRLVAGPDEDPFEPQANAALHDWLSSVDLERVLDLDEGRRVDAEVAAASPDQTGYLGPDGWLMDVPNPPGTRSVDDVEAAVVNYAVREAVADHMTAEGYPVGSYGFFGSIKCTVEQ